MRKYPIFVLFSLAAFLSMIDVLVHAQVEHLPVRESPRPMTSNGVPHVQIDMEDMPELTANLLRRVAKLPGVELRETVVSLPGAIGFWLADDRPLGRPEVIVRGREFAHIHPDGSLHASLSPATARAAVKAGWAIAHPWAHKRPKWEGLVMIYTPMSNEDVDVVFRLVVGSYEFVTGQAHTE